ncbi:MAG: hypothetical protein N3F09_07280 [Bacteroidia bacterium]|nr:hypothetical protein [Bacteroidia bacterium]
MSLLHRLKLYGIGFIMGTFLVFFFFGFRTCSGISDVKLYELSMQEFHFSPGAKKILDSLRIPVHYFRYAFKCGDWKVNFEKSQTRLKPCRKYVIEPTIKSKYRFVMVTEDCDRLFIVHEIRF